MRKFKQLLIQFIKFGFVGCLNTLFSLAIYYLLLHFGISYMPATAAGYVGSAVLGYILSRVWVFQAKQVKIASSALKYAIVYGVSLLINMGCMYLWVDVLHLSEYIAPILTLCITVPFNFILEPAVGI